MAKPYSEDLRRWVVETIEAGAIIPDAAEQCGVSISSVVRFLKLHRSWVNGLIGSTSQQPPISLNYYLPFSQLVTPPQTDPAALSAFSTTRMRSPTVSICSVITLSISKPIT
jgi:hypothetical protein